MTRPRIGFLGVGWIGRHRMEAMLATGTVDAVAIADFDAAAAAEAQRLAPDAEIVPSLEAMLALAPDGVVIATPSALHAAQSMQALDAGAAVFCQKPLGRTAAEVEAVVDTARRADRLLGVDLSYRFTDGMQRIRALADEGALGRVFAADLTFHNGYGPDKPWFYDPALSGGGCVMDLGVHLVDLALWLLGFPEVIGVSARLSHKGRPVQPGQVEDHAVMTLDLVGDVTVRIACSWCLQVGCDAVIAAEIFGTDGGAALRNVGGSFYDFTADRFSGTASERLASPPDAWGGRAAEDWVRRLARGEGFAGTTRGLVDTARVLDRIYGRVATPPAAAARIGAPALGAS